MTTSLPLLGDRDRLVTPEGTPTLPFQNDWQKLAEAVEAVEDALAVAALSASAPSSPPASLDFGTSQYFSRGNEVPISSFAFTRSGEGTAIGGGRSQTFPVNAARIHNGELQIDGGGTNLLLSSANLVHANWNKTDVDTPVTVAGPGGTGTATEVQETIATGLHGVMQLRTVASDTTFIGHAIVKLTNREHVQLRLFNNSTSEGVSCRYYLSGVGSIISPYPAALGVGPTSLKAGIFHLGDGFYLCWLSCIVAAATTGVRLYIDMMSNSTTTSYAGSTAAKMALAGAWITTGQTPTNYIPSTDTVNGSRAAEVFPVSLLRGYYLGRIVDEVEDKSTPVSIDYDGDTFEIVPATDRLRVRKAVTYTLNAYDTVVRADTSPGSLGIATDGGTYQLLKNPGAFPMVAATNGQVLNNTFAFTPQAGADGAVYAVRTLGASGIVTRFLSADIAWDNDTGSTSNTSFALLTSNDVPNLTAHMPVHAVVGRTNLAIQYRSVADGFVNLGVIKPALGSLAKDGTYNTASIAVQGNKAKITWAGASIVVQHDILLDPTAYAVFELFSNQPVGSNTDRVKGKNLLASVAEVGDPLVYVAAAPINIVLPFASGVPTAGNTYSASSTQGGWTSNNGAIVFTYQWQYDNVDVAGATNATFVTVNGVDEGKKVSVRVIATNTTGSTSATSPQSAALA